MAAFFIKEVLIMNKKLSNKGFTLIELIVVLAVLGIIALIAIPRYLQVQRDTKIDADYGTAASIAKAAEIWFVQNGSSDTTPDITTDLVDNDYLDEWNGWQYFDNSGNSVYIEIDIDTGGTVGVYASNDDSGEKLFPPPSN